MCAVRVPCAHECRVRRMCLRVCVPVPYVCLVHCACPCVLSVHAGTQVLRSSRVPRFLGSDNQETFFASTERHQIVSGRLWAPDLPALSRERRPLWTREALP